MLGPGWGSGGPGRAGGCKASKQPSGVGPPWAVGAFPKAPHFSCFQSLPWEGWGIGRIGAPPSGRGGTRGAQKVHSFMREAFIEHLLCAKLALGVSSGHTHVIQPGVVSRQKVPVRPSCC